MVICFITLYFNDEQQTSSDLSNIWLILFVKSIIKFAALLLELTRKVRTLTMGFSIMTPEMTNGVIILDTWHETVRFL
jgi:hypothetical protein